MPPMPKPAGPAVIFDDGSPCENIRSNRLTCQSPIDRTKSCINNFSCVDPLFPVGGAFADFSVISGGQNNEINPDGSFGTIAGGANNFVGDAFSAIGGGAANVASGSSCFAAGLSNEAGPGEAATAFGAECVASGTEAFAAGFTSTASGANATAFGGGLASGGGAFAAVGVASGDASAAFNNSTASGLASHSEGTNTNAVGISSHAEGSNSAAIGDSSHAEGDSCSAEGLDSHAEGQACAALAEASHAQGGACSTVASTATTLGAITSHVQGSNGVARLFDSDTHGWLANTPGDAQHTNFFLYGISPGGGDPIALTIIGFPVGIFDDEELHLENNKVYKIKLDIVAHNRNPGTDAAATKWAEWNMSFLAYEVGGAAVVVGTVTAVAPSEESPGPTGWTIDVTAVGDIVRVTFTSDVGDATPVQAFTYVQFLELGNPQFSPP